MKASDIPDEAIVRAVWEMSEDGKHWVVGWVLASEKFPEFPEKVVQAKLRKALGRGLLAGCPCGCRGDWTVTEKGHELLEAACS